MKSQAIREAFAQAAKMSQKPTYRLKGRGHDYRVCLETWVSAAAAKALTEGTHYDTVCVGSKHAGPRRVFALEIVEIAAKILGVDIDTLVTRNYRG